jgi:phosphoribosyl 1,2-cyclic phosphodiesterase
MPLRVKFWGVRGSIACATPDHIKYGGNTSCIEIQAGENRFIMDAGTGIRSFSKVFYDNDIKRSYLLLTHTHWDHINGFPFFSPLYDPSRAMTVMAGHLKKAGGIRKVLSDQMKSPFFPIPLEAMKGQLSFQDFDAGENISLFDDLVIRTAPLNHPQGATGYRIDYDGKSVVYITDTEHIPGSPDQNILKLIEGSDVVIYDSTYTEEEFPDRIGWGHSTWNEGVRLCKAANAKQLAIFHHEPEHTDDIMDLIAKESKAEWDQSFVCREGMELVL